MFGRRGGPTALAVGVAIAATACSGSSVPSGVGGSSGSAGTGGTAGSAGSGGTAVIGGLGGNSGSGGIAGAAGTAGAAGSAGTGGTTADAGSERTPYCVAAGFTHPTRSCDANEVCVPTYPLQAEVRVCLLRCSSSMTCPAGTECGGWQIYADSTVCLPPGPGRPGEYCTAQIQSLQSLAEGLTTGCITGYTCNGTCVKR